MTYLPASDEAYDKGRSEPTCSLKDAMTPDGAQSLSAFAGIVLIACFFGKNLVHLHRSEEDDNPEDLNGEFWKRHRKLDNFLINTTMFLPEHLRVPTGMKDVNVVYLNMN